MRRTYSGAPRERRLPMTVLGATGLVGQRVIAIGNPFGLVGTMTVGIISGKGRTLPADSPSGGTSFSNPDILQTDAAINPGNSGGPLLNSNGEVIGVNTMIATSSGGYQGIGFALPINTAARSYNQIIQTGRVSRGSIGIRFPRDLAKEGLGVKAFYAMFRRNPKTPFDWSVVRVLGYVR